MIQIFSPDTGITLRCIADERFKHGVISLQFLRPLCRQEAARNALIPAVLLRGCESCPDLRSITMRLDDLYGASIGTQVRRVGDYQTTGLYASFLEDRFAMDGDRVFAGVMAFLKELLLQPVLEQGCFCADYVESEKTNLIATIEAQKNDKQAYAMGRLIRKMCSCDPYGTPRLGEAAWVREITSQSLYAHYQSVLRQSRVEICYVGAQPAENVAQQVKALFADVKRDYVNLPDQTGFHPAPEGEYTQTMDVSQGKLCLGFVTPVTIGDPDFAAMQVLNMIYGGGMTGKLFMQVREKLSLCYAIGSSYHGTKGILTVYAGIDTATEHTARQEILRQLDLCREGQITREELTAAKEALRSSLLAVHDSPGAMEGYYANGALSGLDMTPEEYIRAVEQVTVDRVARLAQGLRLHSTFFLKGVEA